VPCQEEKEIKSEKLCFVKGFADGYLQSLFFKLAV